MYRGTTARRNQYSGVISRGPPRQNSFSDALWHGGPRVGIHATGSGPLERRYEDYQPNLEPNSYSDAPPEIRSVPAPQPLPHPPRPRPSFTPHRIPASSRGRGSSRGNPSAHRGTFHGRPPYQGSARVGPVQSVHAAQGTNAQGSAPSISTPQSSASHSFVSRDPVHQGAPRSDSETPRLSKGQRQRANKQARKLASLGSTSSESITNGPRAQSHEQPSASGSGKAQQASNQRNLPLSSRTTEGRDTDVSTDTSSSRSKHTGSKGKAKAQESEEGRWHYDDSPAIAIIPSSSIANTSVPTRSISASQTDRPRWVAYPTTREPSHKQPELSVPNRWTRNHEAAQYESSTVPSSVPNAVVSQQSPQSLSSNNASRPGTHILTGRQSRDDLRKPIVGELKSKQLPKPASGSNAVASSSMTDLDGSIARRYNRWVSPPRSPIEPILPKKRRHEETNDSPDHRRPKLKFASQITQPQEEPSSATIRTSIAPEYRTPREQQSSRPPSMFATTTGRSEQRIRPTQSSSLTAGNVGSANVRSRLPTPPVEQKMPLVPSTTYFKKPATSTSVTYTHLRQPESGDLTISPNGKTVKQVRRINTPPPDSDASSDSNQENDPLEAGSAYKILTHRSPQPSRNAAPLSAGSDYGSARSRPLSSAGMQEVPRPESPADTLMDDPKDKAEPSSSNGYMTALATSAPAQSEAQLLSSVLPDLPFEVNEKRSDDGMGEDDEIPRERREQQAGAEFIP